MPLSNGKKIKKEKLLKNKTQIGSKKTTKHIWLLSKQNASRLFDTKKIIKMIKMVEIREKLKFSILYLATITTYITGLIIVAFISFLFYAIFCSNNEKNIYLKKKINCSYFDR